MCGRFASTLPPEALARIFGTVNPVPNSAPTWNLAPSQDALVVRRHPEGARHLDRLSWGLLPHWTKEPAKARRPINARAETVASSPMFKGAFASRRCLVPATAFYEWRKAGGPKQPFAFARRDGQPIAFAGLWESFRWPSGEITRSFVIITTSANDVTRPIHDRMPVILEPVDWPVWLGEREGDTAALLRPAGEAVLKLWPISTRVNAPRNNTADLLDPLALNSA
ncbi:MAG TPA: SOS response-associated peptidase [Acetobacteraceae bacterium]|nr:SOS response-associated peptidase [Acetobacteraceae bacterium]